MDELFLLRQELGDNFQLRMYNDSTRSFHPKAYIFEFDNCRTIFVGSSNISKSALTIGIEWNYCLQEEKDPDNYKKFCATFEELWCKHSFVMDDEALHHYSKTWHRPAVYKDMQRQTAGIFLPCVIIMFPMKLIWQRALIKGCLHLSGIMVSMMILITKILNIIRGTIISSP